MGIDVIADHGGVWLDVVSAVDYLTTTRRPGLTVWDALDEAMRWWAEERVEPRDGFPPPAPFQLPWDDPDPLRSTIERLLSAVAPAETPDGHPLADALSAALGVWVAAMADEFNDGHCFAHPQPRRDRAF
jgi:hypothetical protein